MLPYLSLLKRFYRCKDSANRVKNQIYLSFSEMQPIFGGVIPPKIRLIPQISKDIRDLTFVESLSRLGRPQTSLGLLSLLGDFYPFVSVSQRTREASGEPSLLELFRAEAVFRAKPKERRARAVRPIGYFAVLQDAEQISFPAVQSGSVTPRQAWRCPPAEGASPADGATGGSEGLQEPPCLSYSHNREYQADRRQEHLLQ